MSTQNDPGDKMFKTSSLDREEAFPIVRDFGLALSRGEADIQYSQTEGVILYLPDRSRNVRITHTDFDRILRIFEEDPYGPKLDRMRERGGIEDSSHYEDVIEEAVNQYFPSFHNS